MTGTFPTMVSPSSATHDPSRRCHRPTGVGTWADFFLMMMCLSREGRGRRCRGDRRPEKPAEQRRTSSFFVIWRNVTTRRSGQADGSQAGRRRS